MRTVIVPYTERELNRIEGAIRRGEPDSFNMLKSNYMLLAKRANSRLLRLEKEGLADTSPAYGRATFFNQMDSQSSRFTFPRGASSDNPDGLLDSYRELRTFLNRDSSKVKYVRETQKKTIESLSALGIKIEDDDRKAFFSFIGSPSVQDAIEYIGQYDLIFDAVSNNFDEIKKDFNTFQMKFESFLKGEIFMDELLERVGGMTLSEAFERQSTRGIDYTRRWDRSYKRNR